MFKINQIRLRTNLKSIRIFRTMHNYQISNPRTSFYNNDYTTLFIAYFCTPFFAAKYCVIITHRVCG